MSEFTRPDYGLYTGMEGSMLTGGGSNVFGMSPSQLSSAGAMVSVVGAVNSAIGTYYAAKAQQYQLKSQALTLDYQKSLSQINARQSEFQAQSLLQAGERQAGQLTMRYGKAKGARRASTAAAGISMGVGSAAEVEASQDIAKETDVMTINANAVRASEEARMRGVGYSSQALMQGVSAQNLYGSADTISPFGSATSSLMGSATSIAGSYFKDKRLESLLARQG
jgi:hypothetical protein